MKVTLSGNAGFCFGVRRAIEIIENLKQDNKYKTILLLGEIVHNETVINTFLQQGFKIIHDVSEAEKANDQVVVIQSHGAPIQAFQNLESRNIIYIDATCPMVSRIHDVIRKREKEGCFPVIIGKPTHEEVKGIRGQIKNAFVVCDPDDVRQELFQEKKKVCVVIQSTFIQKKALAIVEKIRSYVKNVVFENTICKPTLTRQKEAEIMPSKYDHVLVIGSKKSSNTRHLYEIAHEKNPQTWLVSSASELDAISFQPEASIFIMAGASTPDSVIRDVMNTLQRLF